jgi:hypothetical protein
MNSSGAEAFAGKSFSPQRPRRKTAKGAKKTGLDSAGKT